MRSEFDGHRLSPLTSSDEHTPVPGKKRPLQSPGFERQAKLRKMDSQNGSSETPKSGQPQVHARKGSLRSQQKDRRTSNLCRTSSKTWSMGESDDDCDFELSQGTRQSTKRGRAKRNGSASRNANGHLTQKGVLSRGKNGVTKTGSPVTSQSLEDAAMSPVIPLQKHFHTKNATSKSGKT